MNLLNPKDIDVEDLKGLYKEYASIIGIDNLIALSKAFGGAPIYIPTYVDLIKPIKYKKAMNDYKKGLSNREIARKYGISERTVYNLIKKRVNL